MRNRVTAPAPSPGRLAIVAFAVVLVRAVLALPADASPATLDELRADLARMTDRLGPDHPDLAARHDSLLARLMEAREFDEALPHARRALEIRSRHLDPDDEAVGYAWQSLAYVHYNREDYAPAAEALENALRILQSAGTDVDLVWVESDLGEIDRLLGRFADAERHMRAALDRSDPDVNPYHPLLLNNLGLFYWDQDRLDDAEPLLREAMARTASDADPLDLAGAHLTLGVVLRSQYELEDAELHLVGALEMVRGQVPPGDVRLLTYLNGPAGVYSLTGRFDEARALREEALLILDGLESPPRLLRADILHRLGEDLLAEGRPAEARARFEESRVLRRTVLGAEHASVGLSLAALAEASVRERGVGDAEAGELIDRALHILDRSPVAAEQRARTLVLRARHRHALGRADQARRDLESALGIADELRAHRGGGDLSRVRFLQEFLEADNDLVAWLVETDDPEAALRHSERMKARVLGDQLAAARVNLRAGIPAAVLVPLEERETAARIRINELRRSLRRAGESVDAPELAERIAALEADLDEAMHEFRAVSDEIRLHSPQWRRLLRDPGELVTPERIREAIGPDASLLTYQVGPRTAFAFFLPPAPAALQVRELEIPADVAGELGLEPGPLNTTALRRLLEGGGGGAGLATLHASAGPARGVAGVAPLGDRPGTDDVPLSVTLRALRRILVPDEWWSELAAAREAVLVPDGQLTVLPFEALVLSGGGEPVRYWLDEGPTLRYGHSVASLLEERGGHRAPDEPLPALSVCDPRFGAAAVAEVASVRAGERLARLPGTAREGDAVRGAFAGACVLRGEEATETRVKRLAPRARYLHFATHGLVDREGDDLLAALALAAPAAGERDDGFLHLFEIYELDLDCELAVLSACDTNAGRVLEGEGVFALSRGFLVAGARQVVASLWPLHDEASGRLMETFFGRIAADARGDSHDIARFLRDAKRELRSDDRFAHPHYWAPFVLSGRAGAEVPR